MATRLAIVVSRNTHHKAKRRKSRSPDGSTLARVTGERVPHPGQKTNLTSLVASKCGSLLVEAVVRYRRRVIFFFIRALCAGILREKSQR